jgi:hypothetical protein
LLFSFAIHNLLARSDSPKEFDWFGITRAGFVFFGEGEGLVLHSDPTVNLKSAETSGQESRRSRARARDFATAACSPTAAAPAAPTAVTASMLMAASTPSDGLLRASQIHSSAHQHPPSSDVTDPACEAVPRVRYFAVKRASPYSVPPPRWP